jgi:hypothetical protein
MVGHQLMADALRRAYIVKALDAEFFDKAPTSLLCRCALLGGGWDAMIEHDNNAFWVPHLENIAPLAGHEIVIKQNDRIDLDRHQIARAHLAAAALGR